MPKVKLDLTEDEIAFIDRRIEHGWAVSRPEVIRQALLALYLRWQWLGEKKFRAEMLKTRKKMEKLRDIK